MSFSTNMKKVAVRLLSKYGDTMDVVVKSGGAYNPSTGEVEGTQTITHTIAYVGNFTLAEQASDNVNSFDMKMIFSLDFALVKDDTVIFAGKELQIINVMSVITQDTMIIQTVQARAV